MMKRNRFALAVAVLALGAAACGDDVQVVEPTPPVPPPPPPVTATMAPASASVVAGGSVVFAVNASGGVAGDAASWTCASSNTGIATVSVVSAGCQATGVTAGAVTITAAVSKSGETVNVGAELTVTSDEPPPPSADAIVTIYSILNAQGTPAVPPISGRNNVVVNVDRGTSTLYSLALLVDGDSVAGQSFVSSGSGMAAPADDDGLAEQASLIQTVLTLDTDDYVVVDGVGIPRFYNGDHTVSARLTMAGADLMAGDAVTSNEITVRFSNANRFNLELTADGEQAIDSDGLMWNAGAVTATAEPVIYSDNKTISQLTFSLRDADGNPVRTSRDDGDATVDTDEKVASLTDAEAPFAMTWDNESASSTNFKRVGGIEPGDVFVHVTGSAFADGTAGPTFSGTTKDRSYHMRLDNKGPSVKNFHLAMLFNKHYNITNWVGAGHEFTFAAAPSSGKLTAPDFSDAGVGRDRSHHEYRAGTSTSAVKAVSTPKDLSETTNNRAYVLSATVRDLLGNETTRWWAGAEDDDGLSNSSTSRSTVDRTDNFKFGVDLTAPTQELLEGDNYIGLPAGVIDNIALGDTRRSVGIDYNDPGRGSGFSGSGIPVHTRIRQYAPELSAQEGCITGYWHSRSRTCDILGDPGSRQTAMGGTGGLENFASQSDGYYAIEYAVMDDAGNRAPVIEVGVSWTWPRPWGTRWSHLCGMWGSVRRCRHSRPTTWILIGSTTFLPSAVTPISRGQRASVPLRSHSISLPTHRSRSRHCRAASVLLVEIRLL